MTERITYEQAAYLVAMLAAADRRTIIPAAHGVPGEIDLWHAGLNHERFHFEFGDAQQALIDHLAESTEFTKIAHVTGRAETAWRTRRDEQRKIEARERFQLETAPVARRNPMDFVRREAPALADQWQRDPRPAERRGDVLRRAECLRWERERERTEPDRLPILAALDALIAAQQADENQQVA